MKKTNYNYIFEKAGFNKQDSIELSEIAINYAIFSNTTIFSACEALVAVLRNSESRSRTYKEIADAMAEQCGKGLDIRDM